MEPSYSDVRNDPDGQYANLAASILADLVKAKDWGDLILVLWELVEPRDALADQGYKVEAAMHSAFLDGTLAGLTKLKLPPELLQPFLTALVEHAEAALESWDIELPHAAKKRPDAGHALSDSP